MIAAISALTLLASPIAPQSGKADAPAQGSLRAAAVAPGTSGRRPAEDPSASPVVVVWDEPAKAGLEGQAATIYAPIASGTVPHQRDVEAAVALDRIEQARCGDDVIAVIGGDGSDGGIAGGGPSITLTLIQAPSSIVIPATASLDRVNAYLRSILSDQVSLRIGIAFRSTGAPNIIGVTASRWTVQSMPPSLASMLRSGTSGNAPDDARFLPEPPAPFGTGPAANTKLRVAYSAPQSSNRPRYSFEDRLWWTVPQLKAAWAFSLPATTAYDAQISVNTNAAIFQNLDFDPSDGVPAGKYSFEDLIVRQIVQSLGWTCAASVNLRQEMSVMDLYRFSADRISLTSALAAPDTGTGFMIQPPDAFFSLDGCSSTCDNVQIAIDASVAAATPYSDPDLGNYRVDLNPGIMRPLRFNLVDAAFDTIGEQDEFVETFLTTPPAGSGFVGNPFGWVTRLQFGGPGILDDAQLTPPPAPALRTAYTDAFQQQYRSRDVGTNGVAFWPIDDPKWLPLDSGLDGSVNALVFHDDGSGLTVYAGGSFRNAGSTACERIARWTGTAWEPVGTGFNGTVNALAVFDDGTGPALYAGGVFSLAGSTTVNRIAKWNGSTWSALDGGANNAVNALATFDDGTGLALYAGGAFTSVDGVTANRLARWDGTAWSAVGDPPPGQQPGLNGTVAALAVADQGAGDVLFIGGEFSLADGALPASNIVQWDGTAFADLGAGTNGKVWALAAFDEDGPGALPPLMAAGGDFIQADGTVVNRIAVWNGATWGALGTGANDSVRSLAALPDGAGDIALFAGGDFTIVDGVSVIRTGYFFGGTWFPAGSGLSCTVSAIAQEDAGDPIITGGSFTGDFCVLVDYQDEFPGYTPRLVVMGQPDGSVNLNFVTGIDGDPLNQTENGVDLEVPILSNQSAFSSFLVQVIGATETQYLMGGDQLPQATTYFSRSGIQGAPCNPAGDFLSPTELKVLDCLGWSVNLDTVCTP